MSGEEAQSKRDEVLPNAIFFLFISRGDERETRFTAVSGNSELIVTPITHQRKDPLWSKGSLRKEGRDDQPEREGFVAGLIASAPCFLAQLVRDESLCD
jgi:hypothetical protein